MMKLVIPEPCKQNWNEMQPTSEGRFCSSCTKNVIDFTGFTDAQLVSYFKSSPKNVCGKLSSGQISRSLGSHGSSALPKATHKPKLNSIRQSPLFVGLGFSLLNITSCVPTTGKVTLKELEITDTRNANSSLSSEKLSPSENSQLEDSNSKDHGLKTPDSIDRKPEDRTQEAHIPENRKAEGPTLEDGKEDSTPEKTKPAKDGIKGNEIQIYGGLKKIPDTIPGDRILISPVLRRQNHDLLPAKISSYLTNTFQIADTIITGMVRDTAGLPIAGASVVIEGSPIGVVTNTEGRFSLTVPPEQINIKIKLSIQYTGYNEKLLSVHAPFFKDLNISLVPVSNLMFLDNVFLGGIYVKPTKWQRIKNLVTFWK